MVSIALLAIAASNSATLSVGATVVRPDLPPQINVERTRVVVSNINRAQVSAEGGTVRRAGDGSLLVTPAGSGLVRIVFTY